MRFQFDFQLKNFLHITTHNRKVLPLDQSSILSFATIKQSADRP